MCSDPWVLPPGVSENTSMDNVVTINVSNVFISNTIWRKLRFAQTYQGGGWRRWVGIQTVWFETTVHMLFPSNCQYGSFDHDHGLFLTVREYSTSFALHSYNSVSWVRELFLFHAFWFHLKERCTQLSCTHSTTIQLQSELCNTA